MNNNKNLFDKNESVEYSVSPDTTSKSGVPKSPSGQEKPNFTPKSQIAKSNKPNKPKE